MYKFSQPLREKTIKYFSLKHNLEITHAKADEYLSSMAGLYKVFSTKAEP